MRIGITTSSYAATDSEPLAVLEGAGLDVVNNPYGRRLTEDEAAEFLADKHGLIAGLEPLNRQVLEAAPLLKAIARVGIGMANLDLVAAEERGIKVSNTPEGPTNAVAELTVTAALTIGRGIVQANDSLHKGNWTKQVGVGLEGLKVLLVGYGRIGRRTAEMMRVFGPHILVADPFLSQGDLASDETLVNLEEGLGEADIVSLHASGHEVILGEEQFARMKKGVTILNSARGELVDEQALLQALQSGVVGGGWFDAFWHEPYDGLLTKCNNVLLTPHIGTYSKQCRRSMEMAAAKNLLNDLGLVT